MRLTGYCTECRTIRSIQVTGQALVLAQARPRALRGVCWSCQQDAKKRKAESERRQRP